MSNLVISFNGVEVDYDNLEKYIPDGWHHYFDRTMVARKIAKSIGSELNQQTKHIASIIIKRARNRGEIELIRPHGQNYRILKTGEPNQ